MVEEGYAWAIGSPLNNVQREEHWRHFDNSVNAVSFGFVATAILISMFLVMAIFERFLRPTSTALSPSGNRSHCDLEAQINAAAATATTTTKKRLSTSLRDDLPDYTEQDIHKNQDRDSQASSTSNDSVPASITSSPPLLPSLALPDRLRRRRLV
ncbi:hypothetical protein I3842_13G042000 [Carya illinoinensis]|uniref:Uncharacterized protein n=1 Tax=Carya illinoinensis TaxID=32201 RepID=A0A922DB99_CARIL|nr:hypothetical protein I3842_13G042000 [Carya illinoinensis]